MCKGILDKLMLNNALIGRGNLSNITTAVKKKFQDQCEI